jgi:hypothetical protein
MKQALVFVKEKISTWENNHELKLQLLDALISMALKDPEKNEIGFTSLDLAEELKKVRGDNWGSNDPDLISKKINALWKKVEEIWSEKIEGIHQELAINPDFTAFPDIEKTQGGGKGNPSRYRIIIKLLSSDNESNLISPKNAYEEYKLRYICEDVSNPNCIARIFDRGYLVSGWRKFALILVLSILIISVVLMVYTLLGQIAFIEHFSPQDLLKTSIQFIIVYIAVFMTAASFFELPTKKIVNAPWWMQSTDGDRLLEHRTPPKYPNKSIKAVTYTSTCPICTAKVTAKFSRFQFMGRIVGRCENAPVEHVFSFDHVTRSGQSLR